MDGRVISQVKQHLDNRQNVTFKTPKSPGIPTFDPGTHIVRFVITNPAVELPVPSILYFVLPKEAKKTRSLITLNSPEDGTELDYGPATFSWQPVPDAAVYLVSFFEKAGAKPIYSALSKEAVFELSSQTLGGVFFPGKRYIW